MEQIIQNDSTLKFYMESEIDSSLFEWHVELKSAAIKIALFRYINKNY